MSRVDRIGVLGTYVRRPGGLVAELSYAATFGLAAVVAIGSWAAGTAAARRRPVPAESA